MGILENKSYLIKANIFNGLDCDDDIVFWQNDTEQSGIVVEFSGSNGVIDISNCIVVCVVDKSDGTQVIEYMDSNSDVSYRASCLLSSNSISSIGKGKLSIIVYGTNGERQTFGSVKFKVNKDVDNGGVESSNDYPILTKLINETIAVKEEIESKLKNGYFTGKKGEKGEQGLTGATGPQGEKGDRGEKGEQGIQGVAGKDGVNGQDGITPNIQVGTVTTLEAGQQATLVNSGTKENPIFDFGIPQGKSGSDGADGITPDMTEFEKKINEQYANIDIKVKDVDKRVQVIEQNGVGGGNANIDDTTISKDTTWSSEKIEDFVHTNDDVVWSTVQGENLSIEYTKEGYLREVEIWGNTIQGFADCVTNKQIVDSILSTGLDNGAKVNDDGTFTISYAGFSSTTDWSTINKEGFIQLEPNTKYCVGCWRDNGAIPNVYYTLYEEMGIKAANGYAVPTFTTGASGKVILYPTSAQSGKLNLRVVKGDYKLTDYSYDFNLGHIQHLGELYVDEEGRPILDSEGREQYKIEVESCNDNLNITDFIYVLEGSQANPQIKLDNTIFKPNTKYEIIIKVLENTLDMEISDFTAGHVSVFSGRLTGITIPRGFIGEKKAIQSTVSDFSNRLENYTFRYDCSKATTGYVKLKICIRERDTFSGIGYIPHQSDKTTLLLPYQLMKVGDVSDRLYWDSEKKKYVVEKKVNIPEGYDKLIDETLVLKPSQLIETNITKEIEIPCYKDKTHLFVTGGIDGSIKAKVPLDGGQAIQSLSARNVTLNEEVNTLSLENEELKSTNDTQDELINTTMLATDEMYMMLEPLLAETLSERSVSKMVDMYVAMVQRGIKTIEQVPIRYREQVKKILDQLEK